MKKICRIIKYSLLWLGLMGDFLIWSACTESVSPPESMRLNLNINVIDTSGFTQSIYGTDSVPDAKVYLNSISYYNVYDTLSDSLGSAIFDDILPDLYNISVTKTIPAELCSTVTGVALPRVLNGQTQNVEISGSACNVTIYVTPSSIGTIIFSEIYYNGSIKNPIPYYFHDQFTELYNNSDETVYLDSLIIADAEYGYIDEDYIHSVHAYMFPGDGNDYPLEPGEMVIVAQDAMNHSANNSLDLSGAEFEYYAYGQSDNDYPATNMIQLHHKYGVDFLYSVKSSAIVLLKVADPYAYGYDNFNQIQLPKSAVLDGVEYKEDLTDYTYKRLDQTIDAGITGGFEMYQSKSIRRKIDYYKDGRAILMDNNNSSIDFEVITPPTPHSF
ncbi:MAG: DUF4876 domain-containing protein [Candidatus Neomarinimicrobiota bacterium]